MRSSSPLALCFQVEMPLKDNKIVAYLKPDEVNIFLRLSGRIRSAMWVIISERKLFKKGTCHTYINGHGFIPYAKISWKGVRRSRINRHNIRKI